MSLIHHEWAFPIENTIVDLAVAALSVHPLSAV